MTLTIVMFVAYVGWGVAALTQAAAPTKKPPSAPVFSTTQTSPALITQGKKVYNSQDCNTCHVIGSTGAVVGPDLTHIGKSWSQAKLMTMIRSPKKIMPKGWMPAYGTKKVSATQLNAMAAYLCSLK